MYLFSDVKSFYFMLADMDVSCHSRSSICRGKNPTILSIRIFNCPSSKGIIPCRILARAELVQSLWTGLNNYNYFIYKIVVK